MMRRPGLGRGLGGRRRLAAALALLTAVAVPITIVISTKSPTKPAGSNVAATTSGAATVQRRDLVATDTEAGTWSYAGAHTVYDQLSGTITWLPRVGQLIKPGQTLLDVAGRPVILMDGRTPAYRDLSPSDSDGADIEQLNRNLAARDYAWSYECRFTYWRPPRRSPPGCAGTCHSGRCCAMSRCQRR